MRIAIIYDWLVTLGGAERVLEQVLCLYPEADLYSLIDFLPDKQRGFILNKKANTSFLQKFPFARKKYRKGQELGLANAVQTLDPTRMAFNAANNGLTWFAKKNAIDRVMMDLEAAAIILTDPKLSAMVTERMAATVDDLKHGKIREVDMRMAAEIKGRILRTNPKLFRRLFGTKGRVGAAVSAPGKSGALYGAGASLVPQNNQ